MGRPWRAPFWCAALMVVLLVGCAAPPVTPHAPEQQCWSQVCARLRPTHSAAAEAGAAGPTLRDAAELARAAEAARAAVVEIRTRIVSGAATVDQAAGPATAARASGGTGVVIAADGLILTNEHVVRGARDLEVVLADGACYAARRVVADARLDLAVIRIEAGDVRPLAWAPAPPAVGGAVVALGYAGVEGEVARRTGRVTDTAASLQNALDPARHRDYGRLVECTAALEPGFSGGPLLDADGRLVGLNVAMAGCGANRRGYAVPLDAEVCRAIVRLVARARATQ